MIEIKNLHKAFKGQQVLRGINLQIPKGEVTVILGGSGCGKTVLMRHMVGLLTPDRGEVLIEGSAIRNLNGQEMNRLRRRFGMVFQHAALFDSMNVFENVAFPLKEHTDFSDEKIKQIVHQKLLLVGLKDIDHKMPSEISGGMRKRVGLARAIVLDPEIILYDEPTTGLDPIMTETIDELIIDMQKKLQITSVVISHDITSTFRIADQIAMLGGGIVMECNKPEEFAKSKNALVQEFLSKGRGGT